MTLLKTVLFGFSVLCLSPTSFAQAPKGAGSDTHFHFDHSPLAVTHWLSSAFDLASTGFENSQCLHRYAPRSCGEQDPLAAVFIGRYTTPPLRLGLAWGAESTSISMIQNRRLRRTIQIGAIAAHLFCGARNFRLAR
jgi:hypothetical protein